LCTRLIRPVESLILPESHIAEKCMNKAVIERREFQ
jgi:hypothetical protein